MYAFANALRAYPHSEVVRLHCVVRVAELDEPNQDFNIDRLYSKLVLLDSVNTGQSDLVANSAVSQIRQKIKSGDQKARSGENRSNPKKNTGNPAIAAVSKDTSVLTALPPIRRRAEATTALVLTNHWVNLHRFR